MRAMQGVSIILHDIRSVHNVGSIFRTADGAGVGKIYLTGYTPAPIDRFGRMVDAFTKVSLGAENTIPWEQAEITQLITQLKQNGTQVIAVEQSPDSVPYKECTPADSAAFIFGNEVEGIPEEVLKQSDKVIELPMKGEKESLNVATTVGIVLYNYG